MSQQEKKLVEELNRQRVEIAKLKNSLNELDKEKESWFRKKEEFSANISQSMQQIREKKIQRHSLNKEVKEL